VSVRGAAGWQRRVDWPVLEDALEALPAGHDEDVAAGVYECLSNSGVVETVSGDKLLGWPNW
jgi:hypothetical protein